MSTIAELVVADDAAAWRALGFTVDEQGCAQVGSVRLRFVAPEAGERGMVAWVLAGVPDEGVTEVDGIPTSVGEPAAPALSGGTEHPLGVTSIDHVVVLTPDLDRTIAVIERSLGLPLKRTRDGDAGGRPVRQAFFRMGEVILEVVGSPSPSPSPSDAAAEPARFFGIAFNVESFDGAAALGADLVSDPKPAVQPGRFIATVRKGAGLGVPVALMG